jgi:predicted O-methyltransferase YrrM
MIPLEKIWDFLFYRREWSFAPIYDENGKFIKYKKTLKTISCLDAERGIDQRTQRIRQHSNEAILLWTLARNISGIIVEIGVAFGGTSLLLAAASPKSKVYGIDRKIRLQFDDVKLEMKNLNINNYTLIEDDSTTLNIKDYIGDNIDFLFIDGNHSFEGCNNDIKHWWSYVRMNGLVAFHDFNTGHPGVIQNVHNLLSENKGKLYTQSDSIYVMEKINEL